MTEANAFRDLIVRVRSGDARAAEELVRRYEPAIRLAVRVRLTDPALRRRLDSTDICNSVLANFFVRAAAGQFELEQPAQLLRLLTTMARHHVTNLALKHHAARRDCRRLQRGEPDAETFVDPGPSPSQVVAHRELVEAVRQKLSPDERRLAEQRALGRSWAEIAADVGGRPDALRMRLARALDRVVAELGLPELVTR